MSNQLTVSINTLTEMFAAQAADLTQPTKSGAHLGKRTAINLSMAMNESGDNTLTFKITTGNYPYGNELPRNKAKRIEKRAY